MSTAQKTQTTTLLVNRPTDFHLLAAHFQLIRYELPKHLGYRNNKNDYGQMHNCLRDRLDYPYKTFKFDQLDGEYKWVVYVLCPHGVTPPPITIPFLSNAPLKQRQIAFDQLEFHILLKLLQIAYVRGEQAESFVGQDFCYIYAKRIKNTHICLQIDLIGDIRNQERALTQEFKVVGQAKPFRRVQEPNRASHAYFGQRILKEGQVSFVHLKTPDLSKPQKKEIYEIRTAKGHRTTLLYHDLQRIDECIGKLLYDFIRGYTSYLAKYGITATSKERIFQPFIPPKGQGHLSLALLNPVYVYDNRLHPTHPLQAYIDLLTKLWPDLQFCPLESFELFRDGAVLIVQDCRREDFDEDGILYGYFDDPYLSLYERYPYVPKQSLNVNLNESEGASRATYFHYPLLPNDKEQLKHFQQKIEMALSQLYLKDVILNQRNVRERLPLAPTGYVFIRKASGHETLLYIDKEELRFICLDEPDGPDQRDELLRQFGVNWEEMYKQMLLKYRKVKDGEIVKHLAHYDVIIGPGIFAELEDMDERVLYDYDEITKRQAELERLIPIDDLKLTPYYDQLRTKQMIPYQKLQNDGLLADEREPQGDAEIKAREFYRQLEQYDEFLEEVRQTHPRISYRELTQGERMERIGQIFNIEPDEKGRYNRRKFIAFYQDRGMFASAKGSDIQQIYKGIWYDENHCYMVGATTSMAQNQPRAHLIRHFDIYLGAEHFDMRPLLLATSVQFVRLDQYTVYPYAFHLIDLYVDNVLRFGNGEANNA